MRTYIKKLSILLAVGCSFSSAVFASPTQCMGAPDIMKAIPYSTEPGAAFHCPINRQSDLKENPRGVQCETLSIQPGYCVSPTPNANYACVRSTYDGAKVGSPLAHYSNTNAPKGYAGLPYCVYQNVAGSAWTDGGVGYSCVYGKDKCDPTVDPKTSSNWYELCTGGNCQNIPDSQN